MNVLMISGDRHLLEEGSPARARLELQKRVVERLDVFVWPQVHSIQEIRRAAKQNHYDVITAQDPFWRGHLAWHFARQTGASLNIQVHTDLSAQAWWRRMWARFQLRRANSIRVVSESLRQQVWAMGVTAPIHVLPVYIDVSEFRKVEPLPHEQKTILWIGRFEPEKNPAYAIHVLQKVRAGGIDAKLVMLGAGSLEQSLRQSAGTFPVEFPGWQDTKPYLQVADVVLCTSRHESWGASIVEALAASVPVVAPDVGIAREAGATIAERSQLAHAVIDILQNGTRGTLLLDLPSASEWARLWRETLQG